MGRALERREEDATLHQKRLQQVPKYDPFTGVFDDQGVGQGAQETEVSDKVWKVCKFVTRWEKIRHVKVFGS